MLLASADLADWATIGLSLAALIVSVWANQHSRAAVKAAREANQIATRALAMEAEKDRISLRVIQQEDGDWLLPVLRIENVGARACSIQDVQLVFADGTLYPPVYGWFDRPEAQRALRDMLPLQLDPGSRFSVAFMQPVADSRTERANTTALLVITASNERFSFDVRLGT